MNSSLRADDAVLPGNPYAIVVARNIFDLNPPVAVDPNAKAEEPPVKIVPNGIMSIFGQLQVLFKVPAAKPGGKDEAYILTEGQSQDDIEVTKINEKAGIVTFNNHGIVQELPLVVTQPSSIPIPGFPAGNPGIPGMTPGAAPGAATGGNTGNNPFNNRFGNRSGRSSGSQDSGSGLRNVPTRNSTFNAASQIPPGMTPEVQTIMIEANRAIGGETAKLLPITELTPQPDSGNDAAPSP